MFQRSGLCLARNDGRKSCKVILLYSIFCQNVVVYRIVGFFVVLLIFWSVEGEQPLAGARLGQRELGRMVNEVENIVFAGEADFRFGRVNVHIHEVRRHFQKQDSSGEFALHRGALEGHFHARHHGAVADIAAIDIEVLHTPAGAAALGLGDEAPHPVDALPVVQLNEITAELPAQNGIGCTAQLAVTGGHELLLAVPQKAECNFRVGQRFMQNDICHKSSLTDVLFQELHAGGRIIEQIVHRYGGAARAGAGLHALGLAALNAIAAGVFVRFGAGQHLYPGHAGDGSKRFAAEAKGVDVAQILGTGNFAGCVAHKGFIDILCLNAAAVIRNLQLLNAAAHDGERDLRCTSVDGVFQQFLCNRSRPLHHLACGDQFSGMLIQYANFCHGVPLSRSGGVFLLKV